MQFIKTAVYLSESLISIYADLKMLLISLSNFYLLLGDIFSKGNKEVVT